MNQPNFHVTDNLLASKGQRFLNYIVDILFIYLIIMVIAVIVAFIAALVGANGILDWMQNINQWEEYLVYYLTMILYFTVVESIFSRSIGKLITKTVVVLEDGSKPDSGIIIKRTLCRIIPFDALSFLSTPSRGWHDSIMDTYVVRKEDFEREKELFDSFDEIGIVQEELK